MTAVATFYDVGALQSIDNAPRATSRPVMCAYVGVRLPYLRVVETVFHQRPPLLTVGSLNEQQLRWPLGRNISL